MYSTTKSNNIIVNKYDSSFKHKIEILGDSDSNGFAITSPNNDIKCLTEGCTQYQNCAKGYSWKMSNRLNAEVQYFFLPDSLHNYVC